jgi:glycosyltransferase involved in cell wall biosynthesis
MPNRPMPPLRILHVTPYYAEAWAYGGIPRLAASLSRGLARRGHAVTVCTTDVRDRASRLAPARRAYVDDGVHVRVFRNLSNRLAYDHQLFVPLGFEAFMRRHARSFDVAHLHACRNLPGAIAAFHLRRAGVPYVIAPNGTAPRLERRFLAKRAFDAIAGRRILRRASRVIAVSRAEERQLGALGIPADALRVVPNPIDPAEFNVPPPGGAFRRASTLTDAPLVLFLGKLTPRKRVDVLIRAMASIRDTTAQLVIAGNDMGSEAAARSLVDAVGLRSRTCFTGLLEGRRRIEALADADVVVYPSEHEVFGLVALEALLAGTPVIVSDDSGCGELVRANGGGLVTPVGDVETLARSIETILDRPDRWRRAAEDAAERIRKTCGADVVCSRLDDVYRELL